MKRHYHSILSKPVDLFCTNALIYSSVETLEFFNSFLGWPLGIVSATFTFRLLLNPIGKSLDRISWKVPRRLEPTFEKLHKTLLLNDLEHDVKQRNLNSEDLETLKLKIKGSVLMRQAIQAYLCLNFARGLSQISLNPGYHAGMEDSLGFFWSLCAPDPFYLAPLITGWVSYQVLKSSFHPFTLPMNDNFKFSIGFLAAVGSIPLPLSYHLSYWTFTLTHTMLKKLNK